MATRFVESATLRLNQGDALRKVNSINRTLRELDKTSKTLKRTLTSLSLGKAFGDAGTRPLRVAARDVKALTKELLALKRAAKGIDFSALMRIPTAGITQAKMRIADLRKQILLTQQAARKGVRVNTTTNNVVNNRVNNNPAHPANQRPPGGRRGGIFGSALGSLYVRDLIIYAAAATVINQAKEGYKRLDTAETRQAMSALTPEQNDQFNQLAQEQARANPGLNLADVKSLMAENLINVGMDVKAAADLVTPVRKLIDQQVAVGQSMEEATDSAFKFIKAAEQRGIITDETGKVDIKAVNAYISQMQAAASVIGREFTAEFVQGATKYLANAKYAMDDKEFYRVLLLNEEMGTRGSTGYNQAIKQFAGQGTTKERKKRLESMGLLSLEEFTAGKVGEKELIEFQSGGAVDEDLLRQTLSRWINEHLIPKLQERGVDTTNPSQVSKAMGQVLGQITGVETATALILREQELNRQVEEMARRQPLFESGQIDFTSGSGILAFTRLGNEFQGVLGLLINKFETGFIPVVDSISNGLSSLSDTIQQASPQMVALTAAVGGIAALFAGKQVLSFFTGMGANTAAVSANTAAINRLTGTMAAGGVSDVLGGDGKNKPKNAPKVGGIRGLLGGAAAWVAGGTPFLAAAGGYMMNEAGKPSEEQSTALDAYIKAEIASSDAEATRKIAQKEIDRLTNRLIAVERSMQGDWFAAARDPSLPADSPARPRQGAEMDAAAQVWYEYQDQASAKVDSAITSTISNGQSALKSVMDAGASLWESTGLQSLFTFANQAPVWGEAMSGPVSNAIGSAGDALAAKIVSALQTPININMPSVPLPDTGAVASGG